MASYKSMTPASWAEFVRKFPKQTALVVDELPTASDTYANKVRFCLADDTWYRCDGEQWTAVTATVDLSKYLTNLVVAKQSDITSAQKEAYDVFDTYDEPAEGVPITGEVAEGDHNFVDGDTVYSSLKWKKLGTLTASAPRLNVSAYSEVCLIAHTPYYGLAFGTVPTSYSGRLDCMGAYDGITGESVTACSGARAYLSAGVVSYTSMLQDNADSTANGSIEVYVR